MFVAAVFYGVTAPPSPPCPAHDGCQDQPVETVLVSQAIAGVTSLAEAMDLRVDDVVVINSSNKLALRLLPCDVLARVSPVAEDVSVLEVEVEIAQRLAACASPVAALDPRVDPRVHEAAGFAVTWWTHYETATPGPVSPGEYADALLRLHAGMRRVELATPHFSERAARAVTLVANRERTPALGESDRQLLLSTLRSAWATVHGFGAVEQLLHGEPHPGNVLSTREGPLFIDFETCCRGPVEFDVAHVSDDVSAHYPGLDRALLEECRRLVLAMVAAWRWDVRDEFPDGHRQGRDILALLREGPPWPAAGAPAAGGPVPDPRAGPKPG